MLWNKIHIAAWWMFVFVLSVSAQEINELTDKLHKSKTNEEKFYALTKLSDYWSYRDTARAFDMLRDALPLTAENSFLKLSKEPKAASIAVAKAPSGFDFGLGANWSK